MSGFRLKLNRLRNIPYASSLQETLPFDHAFEIEYVYAGEWSLVMIKPILVHSVVIFLVQFPDDERNLGEENPRGGNSMALVYNTKDEWSDIEKESTDETEAIGLAIEKYYSKRYLFSTPSHLLN
jgi:hypothetical protein